MENTTSESTTTVTSADGTPIAVARSGDGPPVVLVGGALRSPVATPDLAARLAPHLTVLLYDRRGRGRSGDTKPYAVEREIEDLAALISEAGGSAAVYGHSSGCGLALRAAAHGLPIRALVLHDTPFSTDDEERTAADEQVATIRELLSQGRRGEALEAFLAPMGVPPEMLEEMTSDPDGLALAPTIPYDFEVLDDRDVNFTELARGVRQPALVLSTRTAPPFMTEMGRRIADALPDGRQAFVENRELMVSPDELAPPLIEFLSR